MRFFDILNMLMAKTFNIEPDTPTMNKKSKSDFSKPRMLVLCTGNSCRSQMAEGWIRHFAGDKVEVYSAGVEKHGVNEKAVQIMKEAGIDISSHTSNRIDEYEEMNFDVVLTVCDHAKERCPVFPGSSKTFHHDFKDPSKMEGNKEEVLMEFRSVRDKIRNYIEKLLQDLLYA